MSNPWNLTPRQRVVLRELADVGCRKVVAYRLQVTEQAVCSVIKAACRRMDLRTDMQAAITYDRWRRDRIVRSAA